MRTFLIALLMTVATQAGAYPEYTCLHTCPQNSERQVCDISLVKVGDKVYQIVDDAYEAHAKLKDGRLLGDPWEIWISDGIKLALMQRVDDGETLGIKTTIILKKSGLLSMGFNGLSLKDEASPSHFQVEGQCTYSE